jgi:hypothetical protein
MKTWIIAAVLGSMLAAAGAFDAFAQAGSTGDTLGNTDKSISGERREEPNRPSPEPKRRAVVVSPATRPAHAANSISGLWGSNVGVTYQIKQSGNSFTWISGSEVAHGTINGDEIEASWSGRALPGSGRGRVSKDGLTITWDNGVVMVRE